MPGPVPPSLARLGSDAAGEHAAWPYLAEGEAWVWNIIADALERERFALKGHIIDVITLSPDGVARLITTDEAGVVRCVRIPDENPRPSPDAVSHAVATAVAAFFQRWSSTPTPADRMMVAVTLRNGSRDEVLVRSFVDLYCTHAAYRYNVAFVQPLPTGSVYVDKPCTGLFTTQDWVRATAALASPNADTLLLHEMKDYARSVTVEARVARVLTFNFVTALNSLFESEARVAAGGHGLDTFAADLEQAPPSDERSWSVQDHQMEEFAAAGFYPPRMCAVITKYLRSADGRWWLYNVPALRLRAAAPFHGLSADPARDPKLRKVEALLFAVDMDAFGRTAGDLSSYAPDAASARRRTPRANARRDTGSRSGSASASPRASRSPTRDRAPTGMSDAPNDVGTPRPATAARGDAFDEAQQEVAAFHAYMRRPLSTPLFNRGSGVGSESPSRPPTTTLLSSGGPPMTAKEILLTALDGLASKVGGVPRDATQSSQSKPSNVMPGAHLPPELRPQHVLAQDPRPQPRPPAAGVSSGRRSSTRRAPSSRRSSMIRPEKQRTMSPARVAATAGNRATATPRSEPRASSVSPPIAIASRSASPTQAESSEAATSPRRRSSVPTQRNEQAAANRQAGQSQRSRTGAGAGAGRSSTTPRARNDARSRAVPFTPLPPLELDPDVDYDNLPLQSARRADSPLSLVSDRDVGGGASPSPDDARWDATGSTSPPRSPLVWAHGDGVQWDAFPEASADTPAWERPLTLPPGLGGAGTQAPPLPQDMLASDSFLSAAPIDWEGDDAYFARGARTNSATLASATTYFAQPHALMVQGVGTAHYQVLQGPRLGAMPWAPYADSNDFCQRWYARGRAVDVLYLPDVYEDINVTIAALAPALARAPGSRMLLVQYPGMSGTQAGSDPHTIMAVSRLAMCVRAVMTQCQCMGVWGPTPPGFAPTLQIRDPNDTPRDIVIMGSGLGAYVGAQLATKHFLPSDIVLHRRARAARRAARDAPSAALRTNSAAHALEDAYGSVTSASHGSDNESAASGDEASAAAHVIHGDDAIAPLLAAMVFVNGYVWADKPLNAVMQRLADMHAHMAALLPHTDDVASVVRERTESATGAMLAWEKRGVTMRDLRGLVPTPIAAVFGTSVSAEGSVTDAPPPPPAPTKPTWQSPGRVVYPLSYDADAGVVRGVPPKPQPRPPTPPPPLPPLYDMPLVSESIDVLRHSLSTLPAASVHALQKQQASMLEAMRSLLLAPASLNRVAAAHYLPHVIRSPAPRAVLHDRAYHQLAALVWRSQSTSLSLVDDLERMKLPLLLVAGADDQFVTPTHTEDMARKRSLACGGMGKANDAASGGRSFAEFLARVQAFREPRGAGQAGVEASLSSDAMDMTSILSTLSSASAHLQARLRGEEGMVQHVAFPTHAMYLQGGHSLLAERPRFLITTTEQLLLGRIVTTAAPPLPPEIAAAPVPQQDDTFGVYSAADGQVMGMADTLPTSVPALPLTKKDVLGLDVGASAKVLRDARDALAAQSITGSLNAGDSLVLRDGMEAGSWDDAGAGASASSRGSTVRHLESAFNMSKYGRATRPSSAEAQEPGKMSAAVVVYRSAGSALADAQAVVASEENSEAAQEKARASLAAVRAQLARMRLSTEGTLQECLVRLDEGASGAIRALMPAILANGSSNASLAALVGPAPTESGRAVSLARVFAQHEASIQEEAARLAELKASAREQRHMRREDELSHKMEAAYRCTVHGSELLAETQGIVSSLALSNQLRRDEIGVLRKVLSMTSGTLPPPSRDAGRARRGFTSASLAVHRAAGAAAEQEAFSPDSLLSDKPQLFRGRPRSQVAQMYHDRRLAHAAKMTAMHAQAVLDRVRMFGDEDAYGLQSQDAHVLSAGARRLLTHTHDLRGRHYVVHVRYNRLTARLRSIEAEHMRLTHSARTTNRALGVVRAEASVLSSHDAILSFSEQRVMQENLNAMHTRIHALADRMEVMLIELAGTFFAYKYLTRRLADKEACIRDARTAIGRRLNELRDEQRVVFKRKEAAGVRLQALVSVAADLRDRLVELQRERERVQRVTAPLVDTKVVDRGSSTRMRTSDLASWLNKEVLRQKMRILDADMCSAALKRLMDECTQEYEAGHAAFGLLTRVMREVAEEARALPGAAAPGSPNSRSRSPSRAASRSGARGRSGSPVGTPFAMKRPSASRGASRAVYNLTGGEAVPPLPGTDKISSMLVLDDMDLDAAVGQAFDVRSAGQLTRRDAALAWRSRHLSKLSEEEIFVDEITATLSFRDILGLGGVFELQAPQVELRGRQPMRPEPWLQAAGAAADVADGRVRTSNTGPMFASSPFGRQTRLLDDRMNAFGYASPEAVDQGMLGILGAVNPDTHMHIMPSKATAVRMRSARPPPAPSPGSALPVPRRGGRTQPALPDVDAAVQEEGTDRAASSEEATGDADNWDSGGEGSDGQVGRFARERRPSATGSLAGSEHSAHSDGSEAYGTSQVTGAITALARHGSRRALLAGTARHSSSRRSSIRSRTSSYGSGDEGSEPLSFTDDGSFPPLLLPSQKTGAGIVPLPNGFAVRLTPTVWPAVIARWRTASDRSSEEKEWVGCDRRMFPQLYHSTLPEEMDIMSSDPAYRCNLTRNTLFRLASLPCSLLTALRHCRSREEVRVYLLLCTFLHGQGEAPERRRDQELGAKMQALTTVARGFIARSKPPAARTDEEREWVQYDAILRPHLYVHTLWALHEERRTATTEEAGTSRVGSASTAAGMVQHAASRAQSAGSEQEGARLRTLSASRLPLSRSGSRSNLTSGAGRRSATPGSRQSSRRAVRRPPALSVHEIAKPPPSSRPRNLVRATSGDVLAMLETADGDGALTWPTPAPHVAAPHDLPTGLLAVEDEASDAAVVDSKRAELHDLSDDGRRRPVHALRKFLAIATARRKPARVSKADRQSVHAEHSMNLIASAPDAEDMRDVCSAQGTRAAAQAAAKAAASGGVNAGSVSGLAQLLTLPVEALAGTGIAFTEESTTEVEEEVDPRALALAEWRAARDDRRRDATGRRWNFASLFRLLTTPTAALHTAKERRVQLLLRAYGSDAGEAAYRMALDSPTQVIASLTQVPDALDVLAQQHAARGSFDHAALLHSFDADAPAAAAVASTTSGVLIKSKLVFEAYRSETNSTNAGQTRDHIITLPGNPFEAVAYTTARRALAADHPYTRLPSFPEALRKACEAETGCTGAEPVITDVTVTISFRGQFFERTYAVGKLSAAVYREPFVTPPGVVTASPSSDDQDAQNYNARVEVNHTPQPGEDVHFTGIVSALPWQAQSHEAVAYRELHVEEARSQPHACAVPCPSLPIMSALRYPNAVDANLVAAAVARDGDIDVHGTLASVMSHAALHGSEAACCAVGGHGGVPSADDARDPHAARRAAAPGSAGGGTGVYRQLPRDLQALDLASPHARGSMALTPFSEGGHGGSGAASANSSTPSWHTPSSGAGSGAGPGGSSSGVPVSGGLQNTHAPPLARPPLTHLCSSIPQDAYVSMMRIPLGYAVASECQPNDGASLGRLVIRHEPLHCPVQPGKLCVSVTGWAPGTYSVSVVCSLAYPVHTAVEGALAREAAARKESVEARADVTEIVLSQRLGERKRALIAHVICQLKGKLRHCEQQTLRLNNALKLGKLTHGDLESDDEGVEGEAEGGAASDDDAAADNTPLRAILIARRARAQLDMIDTAKARVSARLQKLEKRMRGIVRSLTLWGREYHDVCVGLTDLASIRAQREADLSRSIADLRGKARFIPSIADAFARLSAVGIAAGLAPDDAAALRQRSCSGAPPEAPSKPPTQTRSAAGALPAADASSTGVASTEQDTAAELLAVRGGRAIREWMDVWSSKQSLLQKLTPAEKVRRKQPEELTEDEKEWMAADRILHPELYDVYAGDLDNAMDVLESLHTSDDRSRPPTRADARGDGFRAVVDATARGLLLSDMPFKSATGGVTSPVRAPRGDAARSAQGNRGQTIPPAALHAQHAPKEEELSAVASAPAGSQGGDGWSTQRAAPWSHAYQLHSSAAMRAASSVLDTLLPPCNFTKGELVHMMSMPWSLLSAPERRMRQLMSRFADELRDEHASDINMHAMRAQALEAAAAAGNAAAAAAGNSQTAYLSTTVRAMLQRVSEERFAAWRAVRNLETEQPPPVQPITNDIDARARELLLELDRVGSLDREEVDSSVLHGQTQRIALRILVPALELALDRTLLEQIMERERAERTISLQAAAAEVAANTAVANLRAARNRQQREALLQRLLLERERRLEERFAEVAAATGNKKLMTTDVLAARVDRQRRLQALTAALLKSGGGSGRAEDEAATAQVLIESATAAAARASGGGHYEYADGDAMWEVGDIAEWGNPPPGVSGAALAEATAAAADAMSSVQSKMGDELVRAVQAASARGDGDNMISELLGTAVPAVSVGSGGAGSADERSDWCAACATAPCSWQQSVPLAAVHARSAVIENELVRIRRMPHVDLHTDIVQSTLTGSYLRGGADFQTKADAIFELALEAAELKNQVKLATADAELHAAHAAPASAQELVISVHGYPQQMARADAIEQLEREVHSIVAAQVTRDVVSDILSWMLEGWAFGEVSSRVLVAGIVHDFDPTIPVRPAEGASDRALYYTTVGPAARARARDEARGLTPLFGAPPSLESASPPAHALAALRVQSTRVGALSRITLPPLENGAHGDSAAGNSAPLSVPAPTARRVASAPMHAASVSSLVASDGVGAAAAVVAWMGPDAAAMHLRSTSRPSTADGTALVPYAPPDDGVAIVPVAPGDTLGSMALALRSGVRTTQASQLEAMQAAINARDALLGSVQPVQEAERITEITERTMRMGMFLHALMFFRAMNQMARVRNMLTGDAESKALYKSLRAKKQTAGSDALALVRGSGGGGGGGGGGGSGEELTWRGAHAANVVALRHALSGGTAWSERESMAKAEAAKASRQRALAWAEARASAGFALRAARVAAAVNDARREAAVVAARAHRRHKAALDIQRVWRGSCARVLAQQMLYQRYQDMLDAKLRGECATKIQAVWRGYIVRCLTEQLKEEMTEFIKAQRRKAADHVMEAYYDVNPLERAERDLRRRLRENEVARVRLALQNGGGALDDSSYRAALEEAEAQAHARYTAKSTIAAVTPSIEVLADAERVHQFRRLGLSVEAKHKPKPLDLTRSLSNVRSALSTRVSGLLSALNSLSDDGVESEDLPRVEAGAGGEAAPQPLAALPLRAPELQLRVREATLSEGATPAAARDSPLGKSPSLRALTTRSATQGVGGAMGGGALTAASAAAATRTATARTGTSMAESVSSIGAGSASKRLSAAERTDSHRKFVGSIRNMVSSARQDVAAAEAAAAESKASPSRRMRGSINYSGSTTASSRSVGDKSIPLRK